MRCGVRVDVVIRYMCIFNSWLCCFNDHYVAHKCMHTHPPAVLFVEGGRGGYGGVHVGVTFIKASLVLPPPQRWHRSHGDLLCCLLHDGQG